MDEKSLLKQLEKEGEQKIQIIHSETQPATAETLLNIMREGAEIFEQKTGR